MTPRPPCTGASPQTRHEPNSSVSTPHNLCGEVLPTGRLTEIFRQAATSQIIVNAHRINKGLMPQRPRDATVAGDFYMIEAQTPQEIQDKVLLVTSEWIP